MIAHRILPEALAELDEAATWYEEQEPGLGMDLVTEYRKRLADALRLPNSGTFAGVTPSGSVIRRFRLQRFSRYAILVVVGTPSTVVAFEHSSRFPSYWESRLEREKL